MLFKRKYIVWFIAKQSDNRFEFLSKKRISASTKDIKLNKDTTISINTEFPTFSKGLTSFFFIDKIEEKLIHFENSAKHKFDGKYYNRLVKEKFFLDATSNLEKPNNLLNTLWLIVGVIIGAPTGILFGYFLFGKMFPLPITP